MTKVIRKYKTWLLAIFGVFLMVTFLFSGPTNPFMPDPTKQVEGTLAGKKVRANTLMEANREFDMLKTAVPSVLSGLGIEEPLHWYMLSEEAKGMGLVGTAADGASYVPQLAEMQLPAMVYMQLKQQAPSLPDQFVQQFAQQQLQQMSPEQRSQMVSEITTLINNRLPAVTPTPTVQRNQAEMALAKLRGIDRMLAGYANAGRISDKRLISVARERLDFTLADVAFVKASQFADDSLAFTDEQIAAQWEKFKATAPGVATTDNPFAFGYEQQPRVKLEFITLERASIENAIKIDPVELSKQWQTNRAKYTGDFATERSRIEQEMRASRVDAIMLDAERAFQAAVRSSLRGVEVVEGVKKLPADWASKAPTMQSLATVLAEGVKTSAKVTITTPVVTTRTSTWTLVQDAMNTPGIGTARYNSGANQFTLSDVLGGLYELSDKSLLGLQTGVPFEGVLIDSSRNAYFILVTDYRKVGPADSLAEVRDRVLKDLREQAAYEKLATRIDAYRSQIATEGLDATVKAINASMPAGRASMDSVVLRSQQFSKSQSERLQELTDPQPLRDAVTDAGGKLGLVAASDANAATRAVAIAIPADRLIALAQVVGLDPLTVEDLRQVDARQAQGLAAQQLRDTIMDGSSPFSFENTKKRLNWQPAEGTRAAEREAKAKQQAAK
ncbi:MAG TPA: hypothetical protein VK157_00320 [Phycisphaerales bacterium]|nr:hypothetical protein [Phycisphaerales bacterium]